MPFQVTPPSFTVVYAFSTIFKHFTPLLTDFLTFQSPFHAFGRVFKHCQPPRAPTTCFWIIPRIFEPPHPSTASTTLPQPLFAFSASTTHFYVFSTNLNCSRVPRRTYTPLQPTLAIFETNRPFLKPHTHSWPLAPFPAISPFPQSLPRVFTRLRALSTIHKYLNAFQSIHTRFWDCPGIFDPFSPIIWPFWIILTHFWSFLPVPFATFEFYYIPTLTPNLPRYTPPIFETCRPFFNSFSSIFIILDHFHLF